MGLFDSLAKQALGGMLGGKGMDGLTEAASSVLQQSGGLEGLKSRFEQAGLADKFDSWTSTGTNQAVEGSQLEGILGSDLVQGLAAKLGMDSSKLSGLLADLLPKIIDQLTPSGRIEKNEPSSGDLQGAIGNLMKGFLG
jgi:uncharacterized protein YidB (DUF937 family)